jgi:hypothetical protein
LLLVMKSPLQVIAVTPSLETPVVSRNGVSGRFDATRRPRT